MWITDSNCRHLSCNQLLNSSYLDGAVKNKSIRSGLGFNRPDFFRISRVGLNFIRLTLFLCYSYRR